MMLKEKKGNLFRMEGTPNDLIALYEAPPPEANSVHLAQCMGDTGSEVWLGGLRGGYKDAIQLVREGWKKGAAKVEKFTNQIRADLPPAESVRRRPVWSHDGHTLDPDRALAGQWDIAWRGVAPRLGRGTRNITIRSGWGGNCNLEADELFWSGAAMIAAATVLEDAGYSVRLVAYGSTRIWGHAQEAGTTHIVVKDFGDPIVPDLLAGMVCHAGVYRTIGFRSIVEMPWDVGDGLGSHIKPELGLQREQENGFAPDADAVLLSDCYSKGAALTNVQGLLKQLTGGSLEDQEAA